MKRAIAIVALAGMTMLAGCNRNSNQTASQASQPAPAAPAAAPAAPTQAAPAPPQIPPSTTMAVATVDSVMLSRDPDSPMTLIIHVAGTVPSSGWTEPQLMAETDASADMTVRTYRLEATSPATASANATPQSLETELRVDDLPPEVKTIRIIAGSNDISAPVTD